MYLLKFERKYLLKLKNVFEQIGKCICPNGCTGCNNNSALMPHCCQAMNSAATFNLTINQEPTLTPVLSSNLSQ